METLIAPPRARVLGASVPGPGHVRRGEGCQDAWASASSEDGTLVIAVADGMGSAPAGADGARAAADAAVSAATTHRVAGPEAGLPDAAAHAIACARLAVLRTADAAGRPPRDLACTLLVAIVTADGRAVAAHVGDGAVVADGDDGLFVLSPPAPSEYLEVTDPITAPDWRTSVRCSPVVTGVRAVAAFTDGVQHAALAPGGSPGTGFLAPLIAFARDATDDERGSEALADLLAGPKINEHSDDDKTLVIATLT